MSKLPTLPALLERFFTDRLMQQRRVSPNTIASYRDTFRLLLAFVQRRINKTPSCLDLEDIDSALVTAFLDDLETNRGVSIRTRNLRLTAIHSFFHFVSYEEPAQSEHIQRVLAVPSKRQDQRLIHFLERREIEALLDAPDRTTWLGRRDHAFLLLAVQTGLRLSELISLDRSSIVLGRGAHVRCTGKGRKERCTPLTKQLSNTLQVWMSESPKQQNDNLFPTIHGLRLSADAVQYLVAKYVAIARVQCPSLNQKRVTPHVLRHTAAMELLQAGIDCTVIALWLGHESVQTTQVYLHAHLGLKEAALKKVAPFNKTNSFRYRANDKLLQFLKEL